MMNYKKGKNVEEELIKEKIPINNLPEDFLWMHVKGGTKVTNVIDFAKKVFEKNEHRAMVWSGSGGGVHKTISCAEIMKRSFSLHQVTRINTRKVEEYWIPQINNLEEIVVTREIPCIHILLSLDEIDVNTLGYQHSTVKTKFWVDKSDTNKRKDFPNPKKSQNKRKFKKGNDNNHKKDKNEIKEN